MRQMRHTCERFDLRVFLSMHVFCVYLCVQYSRGIQSFIPGQPTEIFLVWSRSETNEKSVHVAIENKEAIESHLQNLLFFAQHTYEPLWHFRVVFASYVYRAVSLFLCACKTHCKKKNDGTPKGNLHYGNCRCARRCNSPGIEQRWKKGKRGHTREGRKRTRRK
jgi:hypothetical protein